MDERVAISPEDRHEAHVRQRFHRSACKLLSNWGGDELRLIPHRHVDKSPAGQTSVQDREQVNQWSPWVQRCASRVGSRWRPGAGGRPRPGRR